MKPWVRVLMMVAGIMVMLILIVYTDPASLRKVISEMAESSRAHLPGIGYF